MATALQSLPPTIIFGVYRMKITITTIDDLVVSVWLGTHRYFGGPTQADGSRKWTHPDCEDTVVIGPPDEGPKK